MFDNQHSSRLSSIQLLHLRARQHMAHADASSAAFSASPSSANKPTSLGGFPTQTHLQPGGVLQSQPECSGSHELPSQSPRGLPSQPPGAPQPPQWGGLDSPCPVGSEAGTSQHVYAPAGTAGTAGTSQHVYAPAGTRPQDAAMHALLARLTQERNASAVLPSLPLAAADPQPTPAAVPASPHSAPAPPAAPPDPGLACLTLLDGVAKHIGVSSSLSQQQPPDRYPSHVPSSNLCTILSWDLHSMIPGPTDTICFGRSSMWLVAINSCYGSCCTSCFEDCKFVSACSAADSSATRVIRMHVSEHHVIIKHHVIVYVWLPSMHMLQTLL